MKLSSIVFPPWAKLLAVAIAFAAIASVGAWLQRKADAGEIERLRGSLNTAAADLRASAQALAGAERAITAIDAETAKAIEQERQDKERATAAGKVEAAARKAAERRSKEFAGRLEAAASNKPKCAELLAMDVEAVCGVKGE